MDCESGDINQLPSIDETVTNACENSDPQCKKNSNINEINDVNSLILNNGKTTIEPVMDDLIGNLVKNIVNTVSNVNQQIGSNVSLNENDPNTKIDSFDCVDISCSNKTGDSLFTNYTNGYQNEKNIISHMDTNDDNEQNSSSNSLNVDQSKEKGSSGEALLFDVNVKHNELINEYDIKVEWKETPQIDIPYQNYRCRVSEDEVSDSTDDASSSESELSSEDEGGVKQPVEPVVKPVEPIPRVKGELLYKELPVLEDLKITIPENIVLKDIGFIKYCIDTMVIVQSIPGLPALDEETILFLEDKVPLGQIFEVFGQVSLPYYSIRFNTIQDIEKHGIKTGLRVFYAPSMETFTRYIFIEQLKTAKGSDASWWNDVEPPQNCLDFSDDEQERTAKKNKKKRNQNKNNDEINNDNNDVDNKLAKKDTEINNQNKNYNNRNKNDNHNRKFNESSSKSNVLQSDNQSRNGNSWKNTNTQRSNDMLKKNSHQKEEKKHQVDNNSQYEQWPPEEGKASSWKQPSVSSCLKSSFSAFGSKDSGLRNDSNGPANYYNRHRSYGNPFEQSKMNEPKGPNMRFSTPSTMNDNLIRFSRKDNTYSDNKQFDSFKGQDNSSSRYKSYPNNSTNFPYSRNNSDVNHAIFGNINPNLSRSESSTFESLTPSRNNTNFNIHHNSPRNDSYHNVSQNTLEDYGNNSNQFSGKPRYEMHTNMTTNASNNETYSNEFSKPLRFETPNSSNTNNLPRDESYHNVSQNASNYGNNSQEFSGQTRYETHTNQTTNTSNDGTYSNAFSKPLRYETPNTSNTNISSHGTYSNNVSPISPRFQDHSNAPSNTGRYETQTNGFSNSSRYESHSNLPPNLFSINCSPQQYSKPAYETHNSTNCNSISNQLNFQTSTNESHNSSRNDVNFNVHQNSPRCESYNVPQNSLKYGTHFNEQAAGPNYETHGYNNHHSSSNESHSEVPPNLFSINIRPDEIKLNKPKVPHQTFF